jgi:hypothetical protein
MWRVQKIRSAHGLLVTYHFGFYGFSSLGFYRYEYTIRMLTVRSSGMMDIDIVAFRAFSFI